MPVAVNAHACPVFGRAAADQNLAVMDLLSAVLGATASGPSWQDPDTTFGRHHGMPVPRRPVSFFERRSLQPWWCKDLGPRSPRRRSTRYSSALIGVFPPPESQPLAHRLRKIPSI